MARSLLRQLEQIRRSATYDDLVADSNTSAVAEPTTTTGTQVTLQHDMNVLRTIVRQVKGGTNWFDDLGTYFDPTNTASGDTTTKHMSLANIKGNTLDAKTVIIAVTNDNSASGYTVSGTSTGALLSVTTAYATAADRRGLPIFASTANNGSYYDEDGEDRVCRIDVLDMSNDQEFDDGSGNTIYAKFEDAADHGGTGTGTDVFARFYKNDVECDLTGTGVTSVKFVYPQRKVMSEVQEYEWLRTDFVSSWEGDVELVEDISNLWSFTGATDSDSSPQPWTNTGGNYVFNSDPSNLQSALDEINTEIGDRTYTGNYITSDDPIADSLEDLDVKLKEIEDELDATAGDKYVESAASLISANVEHGLPTGVTYTPYSTGDQVGKNMDVFVDGQLLAADTGVNGANADRDYGETSTSGVTFRFDVQTGRNITYIVRS